MIEWSRLRNLFKPSRSKTLFSLSLFVGVGTGIAAWLFIRVVELSQFWPPVPGQSRFFFLTLNRFWIVALPALGGLVCGGVAQTLSKTVKGTGTAEVMYVIRRQGGHIAGKYSLSKAVASIATICSGGAAGPEAPGVAIGAGIASSAGTLFRIPPDVLRTLTAAGAAAGFAAVFNAPIAGVLFAIEVLLREFASEAFAMVVMATVTASITTHLLMGERVFVRVPAAYSFKHPVELVFYAVLAISAAIAAKLFVQIYFTCEKLFEKKIPSPAVRAMTGGLLVGVMALFIPMVMGNGHDVIPRLVESDLSAPWPVTFLLGLLLAKMVACALTMGSGGSGGLFIPYLMMGAMLGESIGRFARWVFPASAPAGAYMLVGMGALFAGVTFAPFTSILLLFELTGNYNLILPVMFAVGITMVVAKALDPESIDSRKLLKMKVRLHERPELIALENYRASDVMTSPVTTIPEDLPVVSLPDFISRHPHTGFPVLNAEQKVVGLLTYRKLHDHWAHGRLKTGLVKDLMRKDLVSVHPEDALTEVVRCMEAEDVDRVLVFDGEALRGIITKTDVLGIYRALLQK